MPNSPLLRLRPQPRLLQFHGETHQWRASKLIVIDSPHLTFMAQQLQAKLADLVRVRDDYPDAPTR